MSLKHENIVEVFCSLQMEGIHCWPNCNIPEVNYLKYPHRHLFGIKAYKTVKHDDRDVEFIWLKHQIRNFLHSKFFSEELNCLDFGSMSCEMIGALLLKEFKLVRIEVDEDKENGCLVYSYED